MVSTFLLKIPETKAQGRQNVVGLDLPRLISDIYCKDNKIFN